MEHYIHTGNANPIYRPPYCVPHAYHNAVKSELDQMLESAILELEVGDSKIFTRRLIVMNIL